eukprot:gene1245-1570_t
MPKPSKKAQEEEEMSLEEELLQVTEKRPSKKSNTQHSSDEEEKRGKKRKSTATTTKSTPGRKGGAAKKQQKELSDSEEEFNDGFDEYLYKDEEDRITLSKLPEFERENILSERYEQRKEAKASWELKKKEKKTSTVEIADYETSRSSRSADKGETKKSKALKELKQQREKSQKTKETRGDDGETNSSPIISSSTLQTPSSSSQNRERDRERDRREKEREKEKELANLEREEKLIKDKLMELDIQILNQVRLSRNMLVKWVDQPYFEKLAPGFFVRVIIGTHLNNPIYRIGEIKGVNIGPKVIKIENKDTDKLLVLSYAGATKEFSIENVSNNSITPSEHEKWITDMVRSGSELPSIDRIKEKIGHIKLAADYIYTDEDIQKRAQERARYNKLPVNIAFEKAKLIALRDTLAPGTKEYQDVCEQIEEFTRINNEIKNKTTSSAEDIIARINQKNKSLNFKQQHSQTISETMTNNTADPFARRKTRSMAVVPDMEIASSSNNNSSATNKNTAVTNGISSPSTAVKQVDKTLQEIHSEIDLDIIIPESSSKVLAVVPMKKKRPIIPSHPTTIDSSSHKNLLTIDEYIQRQSNNSYL